MSLRARSIALLLAASPAFAQTPQTKPPEEPTGPPPSARGATKPAAPAPPAEVEIPFPADIPIPPAPPLTPQEQLQTFTLAPGFRAELVAADPLIGEPVAMAFDAKGRIWVVEMRGYMPNVDGIGEDEANGRVVILEDSNGDGLFDKQTVFLDKLVMPRAIMLRKGGAIIAEPPALYWCPDANGDGVADEKIPIHPTYVSGGNPEHQPNGLLYALDNWIYNAKSNERYRFNQAGEFLKEKTPFRGQWGIAQDDWGRLYYNYNSDQLRADLLPAQYLMRNSNFRTPEGVNVKIAKDQRIYPSRVTPGVNRGYRPGMLKDGKLVEFTAASWPVLYRGDLFPEEFRGNSFVPEPSANLIKRNVHREKDGYITAEHAYKSEEFMTSTDERFRPVSLYNGPDGALYIVDMYRGIIQHITYVTPWLRRQYIERGLEQPRHQGRIWRIVPETAPKAPKLALDTTPAQLVAELSHPNGWRRDTAQQLLVERGDASVVPDLQKLSRTGAEPLGRLHALWTLEGLEKLDAATAIAALADTEPRIRAAAIRLSERFAKKDPALAETLFAMANDRSIDVQLQLLLSLGEIGGEKAEAVMAALLEKTVENGLARSAALSGLKGRELEFLQSILASPAWTVSSPARQTLLAQLARCVLEERKPERFARLLEIAAEPAQPDRAWQKLAVVNGLTGSLPKGFKPVKFDQEPAALAALSKAADPEIQKRAPKLAALITWSGKPGEKPEQKAPPLTEEQKLFVEKGRELYTFVCGGCHLPNGQGQEGLAPPLANSEWVQDSEQRLIRIALHGVGGPIKVAGVEYNMDMPGIAGVLDDEQIAQVLSYVRRDFGNEASVVEPATVAKVRAATKDRGATWTADELLNVN